MAYVPIKPEEMKKLVLMGKRRPMNFAYNPGPKEDDLLIIDKIKAPEALGRTAKKEGKGTKVALGTFELEGKKLTLKVPKELPGLSKKLRKYLKKLSFSFSVEVLDANGVVLEADLSDEDQSTEDAPVVHAQDGSQPEQQRREAPPETADETATETPPEKATTTDAELPENTSEDDTTEVQNEEAQIAQQKRDDVSERLRNLQQPVADLGSAGAALKKAAAVVVTLLKDGEVDKAEATLAKIEAGLPEAQERKAAQDAEVARQEASQTEQTEEAANDPAPDMSPLIARAAALKKAVAGIDGPEGEPIKAQLNQAFKDIKAKDAEAAEANLTAAEQAVRAVPEPAPEVQPTPEQTAQAQQPKDPNAEAKWTGMSDQLEEKVAAAMQTGNGDLEAINRAFDYAKSQAASGNYDSAVAAAANTVKLLKVAAEQKTNARVAEAKDAAPDNVVNYRASRVAWGKTRSGLQAEMAKLKLAIDTQTKGIPGMEDVANNTSMMFDYVSDIDAALETVLDQLIGVPDGATREQLKKEAIGIIGNYRSTLDNEFFQAVDDNGFTNTTVRSSALTALAGVETALAA